MNTKLAALVLVAITVAIFGCALWYIQQRPAPPQPATKTVIFNVFGIDESAKGTVLIVDGQEYGAAEFPLTFNWAVGTVHTYAFQTEIESTITGKRFTLQGIAGTEEEPNATITITKEQTFTAVYQTEYLLTAREAPGGTIKLEPSGDWFKEGTTVSAEAIPSENYQFNAWLIDGEPTAQNPVTIIMNAPHTIQPQFSAVVSVTFSVEGITIEAAEPILTVDGQEYLAEDLPLTFTWPIGSTHTYQFKETVASTIPGKRATLTTCTGPESPLTASETITINAKYETEWLITFTCTGVDDSATEPIITVEGINLFYDDLPYSIWIKEYEHVSYRFKPLLSSSIQGKRFLFSEEKTESRGETIITGRYVPQWLVTFTQEGLDASAGGVILTVDNVALTSADLPYSIWVNETAILNYTYTKIVPSTDPGRRFRLVNATLPKPILKAETITGHYVTQWQLTFNIKGLDESAIGQGLTIGDLEVDVSAFPYTIWFDNASTVNYQYADVISSITDGKRFKLVSIEGEISPVTVTEPLTFTGSYDLQWRVTFDYTGLDDSAIGTIVTVNGEEVAFLEMPYDIWVFPNASVSYTYADIVSSEETGKRFAFAEVIGPESPIIVTEPIIITGKYVTNYLLTISQSPEEGGTINPAPGEYWHLAGEEVTISAIPSENYRFGYWLVDNFESGTQAQISIIMDAPHIVNAIFIKTARITFTLEGITNDATGTIITVDGEEYSYDAFPLTFIWDVNSTHTFIFSDFVYSSVNGKRFALTTIIGGASPITVTEAINITGEYRTQWKVTFNTMWLDNSATGTVVTVNAAEIDYSMMPYSIWVDANDTVSYEYVGIVSSQSEGKRFRLVSVDGPASPIIVNSSISVTGIYWIQWLVTFTQTGLDLYAEGTIVTVNGEEIAYSDLPYSIWADAEATIEYSYTPIVPSTIAGKRFAIINVEGGESPITINAPTTIIGNYLTQWLVTFNVEGLTSDADGIVLTVNAAELTYAELPYSIWVNNTDIIDYNYTQTIHSQTMPGEKRFTLESITGPDSPVIITEPLEIVGNYLTQWKVVFTYDGLDTSADGVVVIIDEIEIAYSELPYTLWVNNGSKISYGFKEIVSSTVDGKRFSLVNVSGPTSPITITAPANIIGEYLTQWLVTFNVEGLDASATSLIVTVNGSTLGFADLPYSIWVNSDSTVEYNFSEIVASSLIGKRFRLDAVIGPSSPFSVDSKIIITGTYITQWLVTFTQEGLDTSANETVLIVDSTTVSYEELPYTIWVDAGSEIQYTYESIISSSEEGKRFRLVSVNGPESPITVTEPTSIAGYYTIQWRVIFNHTGLDNSAVGTIVIVNDVAVEYSSLPYTVWVDNGSTITYAYEELISSTVDGKRFILENVDGCPSPITVSSPEDITGNYLTQWLVTFTQTGLDNSAVGTIVTVNEVALSIDDLPYSIWVNGGDTVIYSYTALVQTIQSGKRFVLSSVSGAPSPITVNSKIDVTGAYLTQWLVTFTHTGLDNTAIGTIVTVNGVNASYSELPYSIWVNNGTMVTYEYTEIVYTTETNKRFRLDSITGTASPITVTAPQVIAGNYITQWLVTFTHVNLDSTADSLVLIVDGIELYYDDLPYTMWIDNGGTVTYEFSLLVSSTTDGKRFLLKSTAGPSSPITVVEPVTVTGTYNIQWRVTFTVTGLDSTAQGTVVTVNGVAVTYSQLPYSIWVNDGETISYAFEATVPSSTPGKEFTLENVDGPESPAVITSAITITGNYSS